MVKDLSVNRCPSCGILIWPVPGEQEKSEITFKTPEQKKRAQEKRDTLLNFIIVLVFIGVAIYLMGIYL